MASSGKCGGDGCIFLELCLDREDVVSERFTNDEFALNVISMNLWAA